MHRLLADLAGNSAYVRSMRELSTLTCLVILLFDAPAALGCRADEHNDIVEAIARRDLDRAQQLMLAHLDHIEQGVSLDDPAVEADLEAVFLDMEN